MAEPPINAFSHDEVRVIDMLPPGPVADIPLRMARLAVNDREGTLDAIIGIIGIGGDMAQAREAVDLAMPLGQEDRLDTPDGQIALMIRASAILAGIEALPSPVLH